MPKSGEREILSKVRDMLDTAKFGLADLVGDDPGRSLAGLMNVATFGRAVTNVLQNLRSVTPDFDKWYVQKQELMRQNTVCKHFYRIRTEILKQGTLNTAVSVHAFDSPGSAEDIFAAAGPKPPGATGVVLGDRFGGNGWLVPQADGSSKVFYRSFPSSLARTTLVFRNETCDPELRGRSVGDLAAEYLAYLESLVDEAQYVFIDS